MTTLSRRPRVVVLAGLCLGVAAVAYLGADHIAKRRLIAAQEAASVRADSANAALQDQLAKLQDALDATNSGLAEAQSRIETLTQEAKNRLSQQRAEMQQQLVASQAASSTKAGRINQLLHTLDQMQHDIHQAGAARLGKMEAELRDELSRESQLQASLDQTEKRLQQTTADRDRIASERDSLRARAAEIEKQSALQAPRGLVFTAPARPPETAAAAPPTETRPPTRAASAAGSGIGEIERVLAAAGVDVGHVFSEFGVSRAEGGPFVPAPRGLSPTRSLGGGNVAALRGLAKSLPLGAPLDEYEFASPFGERRDPFNEHASFHTGVDLIAPYMAPVFSTAPGVVTYAGYRSDYGKVVEIDHGNGITTRYAHLHHYTVSVGQTVAGHAEIGLLGSTGRTTGPHVHYEVLVNGEPQDPEKFINIGRRLAPADGDATAPVAVSARGR